MPIRNLPISVVLVPPYDVGKGAYSVTNIVFSYDSGRSHQPAQSSIRPCSHSIGGPNEDDDCGRVELADGANNRGRTCVVFVGSTTCAKGDQPLRDPVVENIVPRLSRRGRLDVSDESRERRLRPGNQHNLV